MTNLRDEIQAVYDKYERLTPALVLEEARNPEHPLHSRFEWDDAVAGERHRLRQAGDLIRRIKVTYVETDGQDLNVRAFVSVRGPSEPSNYVPTAGIVDPLTQRILLSQMRREIAGMERRYGHLTEFWDLIKKLKPTGT